MGVASMLLNQTTSWVRFGIFTLPLGGLLVLGGLLGRFTTPNPGVDPKVALQLVSSTGYFVSQFVGHVLGSTLLILGIIALTAYLADTRVRGLAMSAMVLSIIGIALLLSAMGVTTYALYAIGNAYVNGQQAASLAIVDTIFGSPLREMFVAVALFYSAGFILFGIAIWRSRVLSKRVALPIALQAPLVSGVTGSQPDWTTIVGALLFILASSVIALTVFRGPSAQEEAEAEPPTIERQRSL
jgi:hypothetical protein